MVRLLTDRQADELHKSIIAYFSANDLPETAACLRKELGITEDSFDASAVKKYETLLEKKWTSTVRLQKKIMDLESRNAALQSELESSTPASLLARKRDPQSWLPQHPRYSLHSHRDTINCIAFHPKFSSIASGSDDFTIKIWDWELGELEMTLKGHTRSVRDLDYGSPPGGVLLASCSSDLTIKLWNPADGYKNFRTLQGHDHIISAVRFIPNGSLLASASKDNDVRLWDVTNGYCVKTIQGHTGWVRDVCPSVDGKFLLSTGDDMTVRLWDISGKPENKLTLIGHENFNECCAIAPPATYQYLAPLAGLTTKLTAASSSMAEFMATGSRDKTIKIWDARGKCLMTLVGHDNWVRALVFHPGGKYLLSVSDDKTLRCWDLSQQGKCVKTLRDAHESFITCLKWAPGMAKDSHADSANASSAAQSASDAGETMPRNTKAAGEASSEVQIRCVIATGSVDQRLQIFAG